MFDFFFYGTLIDPEIRELVLGRSIDESSVRDASLAGHRRYPVQDEPYPAAIPEEGGMVAGVLVEGLSVADAAWLSRFEGSEYDARACIVSLADAGQGADRRAWVFIAGPSVRLGTGEWSIEAWTAAHKPRFLELAKTWLDGAGGRVEADAYEAAWRKRLDASETG